MSESKPISIIENELENIEIILRHLMVPENLTVNDGEYIGSFLMESGLTRLHKIQDQCDKLKTA